MNREGSNNTLAIVTQGLNIEDFRFLKESGKLDRPEPPPAPVEKPIKSDPIAPAVTETLAEVFDDGSVEALFDDGSVEALVRREALQLQKDIAAENERRNTAAVIGKNVQQLPIVTTIIAGKNANVPILPAANNRQRRTVDRKWPNVGTTLVARYYDKTYHAIVNESHHYKSGRSIELLDGPAEGTIHSSMSGAMHAATKEQRMLNGLGKRGMANGWSFWKVDKATFV